MGIRSREGDRAEGIRREILVRRHRDGVVDRDLRSGNQEKVVALGDRSAHRDRPALGIADLKSSGDDATQFRIGQGKAWSGDVAAPEIDGVIIGERANHRHPGSAVDDRPAQELGSVSDQLNPFVAGKNLTRER